MIITRTIAEFNTARQNLEFQNDIGFVPTMGALHSGHISLVELSNKNAKHTIVSIFINPTQFNNPNDFKTYPREVEKDCMLLDKNGVDIVFIPEVEEIYPSETSLSDHDKPLREKGSIDLGGLDKYGEGPNRPGHFDGVAQVVSRLFDIVRPTKAFFGEKDFQQLAIIKYFSANLYPNIDIIGCPIKRDTDGLALSSRNELLRPDQRIAAPHIYSCISKISELSELFSVEETVNEVKKMINSNIFLEVEYVEIINALTLRPINTWNEAENIQVCCAVFAKPVRLIDNIKLK